MNYRLNSKVITAVAALVVVAVGLFVYTLVSAPSEEEVVVTDTTNAPNNADIRRIDGKHQYIDGVHTIAGMASVETPCHSIVVEPFFPNGEADQNAVELRFTTVLEGTDCPAVPSDAPYKVTFTAPEQTSITATWGGAPAILNLVPVAPGESLDEEFYFKG